MKIMFKLGLLPIIFGFWSVDSKGQNKLDNKFLTSLIYLNTNAEIKIEMKQTFSYMFGKKDKCVEFGCKGEVSFLPIDNFSSEILYEHCEIDSMFIIDRELYKNNFFFDSYRDELLDKVIPEVSSNLVLIFSRPVNNYLIAELIDRKLSSSYKQGKAIQMLFIFDERGMVHDFHATVLHYN